MQPVAFGRLVTLMTVLGWGLIVAPSAYGQNRMLFITENNGTTTAQEDLRIKQFSSWGYTVTTIWDGEDQDTFTKSGSSVDVIYFSEEAHANNDVQYKLRELTAGIVSEEQFADVELGFSTSDGFENDQTYLVDVVNNRHEITDSFPVGYLGIFTANGPRVLVNATEAPGLVTLARSASGHTALGVIEKGGALANTYNGNATAAGRRVRLPFGGEAFDFSILSRNGLLLLQEAILWAAGGSNGTGSSGNRIVSWVEVK